MNENILEMEMIGLSICTSSFYSTKFCLRSVLLGNNVVSNGSLILLVPVSPVLLLLPYLRKFAKVIICDHLLKQNDT